MRRRAARLAAVALAALGLSAAATPATFADTRATACPKGYFCLFEGPHGTGRLLLAEDAHITKDGFHLRELDDIEPPIHPRSAFDPSPTTSAASSASTTCRTSGAKSRRPTTTASTSSTAAGSAP
ncbi:peptidase inhibitor family I36 protein [Kitasatospora sp. LaBMicrA B282]|uniref:peptidase inhibitor family I36 protein n=1 Tax=Kitasatospora sp. LaBMicrA B282 TaxID=3420949 RepID=UPI003D09C4D9